MPWQSHQSKTAQALTVIGLLLFLLFLVPLPAPAAIIHDGFIINDTGSVSIADGGVVRVVAVQPWDGKILIGGEFTITGFVEAFDFDTWLTSRDTVGTRHNLARLNNDGTLDTTFAPEPDAPVNAIVAQRDHADPLQGRIYVGGEFDHIAGGTRYGLARLAGGDGVLDPAFAPATNNGTVIRAMLIKGDRIVVGGEFSEMGGSPCNNLGGISVATGSDGELVETFAGGTVGTVNALLLQEDHLVVGGNFTAPRHFLARFTPENLLDAGFTAEPSGGVRSLALQPDGMLLVGGEFTSITRDSDPLSPLSRNYLTRLTSDGRLTSFNPLLEPFPMAVENFVASVVMQPDGRILAGGKFRTGDPVTPQLHLARFKLDGTPDDLIGTGIGAGTDDTINSIALEPNGRFLVAGKFGSAGGKIRSKLARFYFHGALDDDGLFSPNLYEPTFTVSVRPDGSLTVGGATPSPTGSGLGIAKLRPDLSHDPTFAANLALEWVVVSQSLTPEGKLYINGHFRTPSVMVALLDETGEPDTTHFYSPFLQTLPDMAWGYSYVLQALLVPRGTPGHPETVPPDGFMYIAGQYRREGEDFSSYFLKRLTLSGEVDNDYNPPVFNGEISSIALQKDGKLVVVGSFTESIVRLETSGEIDQGFKPWRAVGPWLVYHAVAVLPNGQILVGGDFLEVASSTNPTQKVARPCLARLNSDGELDTTFNTTVADVAMVKGFSLLSDGSVIIYGVFQTVKVGEIAHPRSGIARIASDGTLLGPRFFTFFDLDGDTISNTEVQPDGKILISGSFDVGRIWETAPMERWDAKYLTRISNPEWATEELAVAPDGSAITWMRGGTGPELWSVWFEEKSDLPGATWNYLGRGERIPGGWRIGGQNFAVNQNRYVRARGYASGYSYLDSGNSQIVESVRLYYLKEPVRVRAQAETKVYGRPNPTSYTPSYFDRSGQPKSMEPGSFRGTPAFSTPATAASGVGDYAINADVSGMSSFIYAFLPDTGTLSVTKATLAVTADDMTGPSGVANRNFTASYSGFVGSDTKENSVQGEPAFTTTATETSGPGSYDIIPSLGTLSSSNYQFSFHKGTLTIGGKLSQTITFGPVSDKTYGDPRFPAGAFATSGYDIAYASSNPAVAVVENGEIVPKGAGTTRITASQGGSATYEAATPVSQLFTVRKKELRVVADPKARSYLTPNPNLTVSYQGFVNGENSSVLSGTPLLTTTALPGSPVGSYPITVGLGSLSADNYFFTPVHGTLTVFQSCQQIVFPPIGERTYGDPPVEITAASCSELTLSFSSSDTGVATVDGNRLTITGAGSCEITASQSGNGDLKQAPDVRQTLVVHRRGQVIDFAPLAQKVVGDPPLPLGGTASSGLSVAYSSSDPAVASVSGSTLTITGAGTTVITARQEGDRNYQAALPASQPFSVALEGEPPLLALSTLTSGSATAAPVINVSGRAQDASGITSLTVNGADLTGTAALFSSAVPLTVGENRITVTAKDGAGNVASESFSVTLDATAPPLSVAEPPDNSVTGVALFSATGTVPAGSTVTMALNGSAPQPVAVTSGNFNGTGYLQPGLNTLELTAELSGRSGRAKRTVTFSEGAPTVAITEPGEDTRTEAGSVVIKGKAGNGNIASVLLEVNGVSHATAVEGGVFQQQIALDQPGEYRVKVTATDSAGESVSASRNIIKLARIPGDLDLNGSVDIGDAVLLLRLSLGIDPLTEQAVLHGDLAPVVNGVSQPDGRIGIGDVLVLLRKIVGLME